MAKPNIKGEAIPANYWFPVVLNSDVKDSEGLVRYTAIQLPVANATATGTGFCNADGTSKHPDIAAFLTVCGTLTEPSNPNQLTYSYLKNNFAGFATSETFQASDFNYGAGAVLSAFLASKQGTVTEYYTLSAPGGKTHKISNLPRTFLPFYEGSETQSLASMTPPEQPLLDDEGGVIAVLCRPKEVCVIRRFISLDVSQKFSQSPNVTIRFGLDKSKYCTEEVVSNCCPEDKKFLRIPETQTFEFANPLTESPIYPGSPMRRSKREYCPESGKIVKETNEMYHCPQSNYPTAYVYLDSIIETEKVKALPARLLLDDEPCCAEYSAPPSVNYHMVFNSRAGGKFWESFQQNTDPLTDASTSAGILTSGQKDTIRNISSALLGDFDKKYCPPIEGANFMQDNVAVTALFSNIMTNYPIKEIFDSLETALFAPDPHCCS